MNRRLAIACIACAALAAGSAAGPGDVPLVEDKPLLAPPMAGDIGGAIGPASQVASVHAVSRHGGKTYPGSFDARSGRFSVTSLPGDASYDVCIKTRDGRRIEGVDLEYADAALQRLADVRRRDLGIASRPAGEFTRADADAILKFVRDLTDFMEIKRPLYVSGHGTGATVLVELLRTREFHSSGGDIIWRVELWYFQNNYGGWDRLPNQERVLQRERLPMAAWSKIDVEYHPRLSVFVDRQGKSKPVEFTFTGKTDPARGRPAGSDPDIKTNPQIIGLAASKPAQD
jgi:hypothetical protein